eukprot:Plantae.Rhodophyta-Palmaria_palmata.ctg13735.p4 GENE.Plantae.Rhodophyta-Palmaria_palmata.ctg13735~~Plantae.Rhodophyta-Palmaria_palmata.ctg13735.p4  ORF type:complete len:106 (+),score=9.37 Plantae.Rhodophyta-Palmaria_palmata.ctg13735:1460-1777(+)
MSIERAVAMRLVLVAPEGLEIFRFVDLGDENCFPRIETDIVVNKSVMRAYPILGVGKAKGGFEGRWIWMGREELLSCGNGCKGLGTRSRSRNGWENCAWSMLLRY